VTTQARPQRLRHAAPFAALLLVLAIAGCDGDHGPSLQCYVADPLRPAAEELARLYRSQTDRSVAIECGDQGALLEKIASGAGGDLCLCHDPYANALEKKKLSRRIWVVASLTPVIAVPKGNPKGIRGLRQLAQGGLRVGTTHATESTLGHLCSILFRKAGIAQQIQANVVSGGRLGSEVADALVSGELDAAILWKPTVHARRAKLDIVAIEPKHLPRPRVDAVTSATFGRVDLRVVAVTVATLNGAAMPTDAAAFAEFAASPQGRAVFAAHGLSPSPEMGPTEASAHPAHPRLAAAPPLGR